MTTFGERVRAGIDTYGPLCVGIDPHEFLLEQWGMDVSAAGARDFGLRVIDAAAGRVGFVKPQVSFYERFGSLGFAALEEVLAAGRAAGLVVIADAKRGDIGTTMDGYTSAWLNPGAPLEADAVTLSPYLGADSLRKTLTTALRLGKGAFVLAATSNPHAGLLQRARLTDVGGEASVAEHIARDAEYLNLGQPGALGSIGLVIGATVERGSYGLVDDLIRKTPILAPGFGAQGATPADLPRLFGPLANNVIASESRSVLSAGPADLARVIDVRASEYVSTRG